MHWQQIFFYDKIEKTSRKEINMALHVMDEASRCLGCKVPQCQKGCPISTPIPQVIRLLKEGKLDEAGRMLFEIIR